MPKYDYLLLHTQREFVKLECEAIKKVNGNWESIPSRLEVVIPIDPPPPNIDPYIFNNPWFYGYCRNANTPKNTAKQSVFLFCTFSPVKKALLVDTVFVVNKKFAWLGIEEGYQPSQSFRNEYSYKTTDALFQDFISPRVYKKQHTAAHTIYAAQHYSNHQIPVKRSDDFFSFIPLTDEGGDYNLIDILPTIQKHYESDLLRKIERLEIQNKLFKVDFVFMEIMRYIFKKSTLLVTATETTGMPKVDKSFSQEYKERHYGKKE
ncbi:hypothetical protein [Paenibacillus sp. NRS-1760]|uniref:hypothetical protein n=1 Tax=Paenibacillus sp. NRS-1760 TaxID=3233902 RepID=UPI003D2D2963